MDQNSIVNNILKKKLKEDSEMKVTTNNNFNEMNSNNLVVKDMPMIIFYNLLGARG